ncbi:unnamed protein product [Mytilus coruscus]|uniref:Reverse transcriptase domain-containing protein n=1 Tax=Mytilus coruscus TaxID=42192 RepID=A0A6J7ZT15_MYTCO|nr:unnamed protein product [Mytilus coruscus]
MLCVNDGQPTRQNTKSVIDLVIITPSTKNKVHNCSTLVHENIRSDHICILTELDVCKKEQNNSTKRKVWQINKVDWNKWKEQAEKNMEEWLLNNPSNDNVDEVYQSLKAAIDKTMQEVICQKEMKDKKSTKPPWWNYDVNQTKKNLNYKQRQYRKRNIPQNREALVTAEEKFENEKEKAMNDWSERLVDQINTSRNSKEGKHLKTDEFDEEFYTQTQEEYKRICELEKRLTKREHKLDYEVTTDEVEAAIYLLEIGKSPGADSHFPELFKFAGENLIEAIRTMVDLTLKHGQLPQEWKTANIKFLRKQGKTNYYSPSSYRPISLTSVMCKITERIVLNRLAAFIHGMKLIEEKQEGFRKKHSTSNCLIRFIQNTIEKFNKGEITLAYYLIQPGQIGAHMALFVPVMNIGDNAEVENDNVDVCHIDVKR